MRTRADSFHQTPRHGAAAVDDMHISLKSSSEEAKRMRRRSMHTLDASDYTTDGEQIAHTMRVVKPAAPIRIQGRADQGRVGTSHSRTSSVSFGIESHG